jgi:hypothetical protein
VSATGAEEDKISAFWRRVVSELLALDLDDFRFLTDSTGHVLIHHELVHKNTLKESRIWTSNAGTRRFWTANAGMFSAPSPFMGRSEFVPDS